MVRELCMTVLNFLIKIFPNIIQFILFIVNMHKYFSKVASNMRLKIRTG